MLPDTRIEGIVGVSVGGVKRRAIPIAATGTTFEFTFAGVGVISRLILEVANYTNNVTTTLSIINPFGVTLYSSAALARNANYTIPVDIEIDGSGLFICRLTLSGNSGGSHTNYVTLLARPF